MTTGRINQIAIIDRGMKTPQSETHNTHKACVTPAQCIVLLRGITIEKLKTETDAREKSPAESGIHKPVRTLLLVLFTFSETPAIEPRLGAKRQRLASAL